jgi:hypothetical protein
MYNVDTALSCIMWVHLVSRIMWVQLVSRIMWVHLVSRIMWVQLVSCIMSQIQQQIEKNIGELKICLSVITLSKLVT